MFGFGKDKDDNQIEPAQGSNGTFERAANSLAQHLISTGIDGVATFDSAANLPKVVPLTVVYNPDGTRAHLYAQTFQSSEEMEKAVQEVL